jgi:MYXO-CTERM domain-containing protein
MRRVLLIGLALVVLHRRADACRCIPANEGELVQAADAVFFGWVTGVARIGEFEHAQVRVDEAVKGVKAGQTVVVSYGVNTSCDPRPLQVGHAYDVFANRRNGRLRTTLCSGTRDVTRAVTQVAPGCGRCGTGDPEDLALAMMLLALLVWRRR